MMVLAPSKINTFVTANHNMKKILVTGSNGLLGQKLTDLYRTLPDRKLFASGRGANRHPEKHGYDYIELDISDFAKTKEILELIQPDVLINAAAMTQVDDCESDTKNCTLFNVTAVENMAKLCATLNIHFIHISTDFIFDGTIGNYTEDDLPNPLSFYGNSKWEGEKKVQQHAQHYAILRTVLVYGVVSDMSRSNIVLWAKGALEKGAPIKVVNDQWRTPTLAEDLAMGCYLTEKHEAQGIYNISGKDLLRIDDLVRTVGQFWNLDISLINEVSSTTLNQAAKRPPKTGFNLSKSRKELGYEPHSFVEGLAIVKQQLERNI
ncbi:MAG: SDR family oxidoreductase [Bacteroidia bacterium]|nr:SDR family oxidoreductase [Bacteroidia bacterium]